jgi:uncharacterized protein involved in oxidation of intracellular sulfur
LSKVEKVHELETMTIIVNGAPYGEERFWNALRLALTSISAAIDLNLNIFLLGDAVSAAKKGQNTPQGFYNLEKMLRDLIGQKVKVAACGTCIRARGLNQEDLVEGIEIGTMMMLARWIKESQKVLSF